MTGIRHVHEHDVASGARAWTTASAHVGALAKTCSGRAERRGQRAKPSRTIA